MRPIALVRASLALSAFPVLVYAATPPATAPAAPEKIPGQAYFGTDRYVEYVAGDLPLVFTSPHGGRLKPETIPDRKYGAVDMDANTQELARAIIDEIQARTGHRAHLVASHLHRGKLDPNREIAEAAQGSAIAERAWNEYHAAIKGALAAAVARHGFAFLIDIHGHAHPVARLELGYALDAKQLNQSDKAFDDSGLIAVSTLRDLATRVGGSPAALLRGPRSLGDFFNRNGYRATPAPQDPQPGETPFFSGGYTVRQHASAPDTPKVDGLQIETNRVGVRDTAENRAKFAKAAAESLLTFVHERYNYDFPAAKK